MSFYNLGKFYAKHWSNAFMRSAFVHIQKGTAQQKSLAKNVTLVSDLPTTGKLEEFEFSRQKKCFFSWNILIAHILFQLILMMIIGAKI